MPPLFTATPTEVSRYHNMERQMTQFRVTRSIAPDIKLVFTWHGGEYIDIKREGDPYPTDVINVWDYEAGAASIPFTKPAMRRHIDDWLAEYPVNELADEIRENW